MPENSVAGLKQLQEFWGSLSTPKRVALGFVTTSVLVLVLLISVLSSNVTYDYLYTNLEQKDAAAIAAKLNELKVPHKIEAAGIKVPADQVHALRLELAGSGLPSGGGVGNEIFDQSHLGATEFEQSVNLRRALEGELARSITTIEGVETARVHLVLPKNRVFAAKTEGASASVIVRLRNRHDFGRREVAGIVHLVATAVPNLSHDRVSVVDSNGVTLHRPDTGGQDGLSASDEGQLELAQEAEAAIEERVRTLLERSTGAGAVDVRVRLSLDRATRERTEEHYDPRTTVLRSEHKTEEWTGIEEARVAGVPGAQTNLPDVEPTVQPQQGGADGNAQRRAHTRNWEMDRVVEKILKPAGEVTRLSVAVLVDGRYEEHDGQKIYTPRPQEELDALATIVRGAVGVVEERGDTVQLQQLRFVRPDMSDADAEVTAAPPWMRYAPYAAIGAGTLFFLALLVLVWRGKREARKKAEQEAKLLEARASVQAEEAEERRLQDAEAHLLGEQESVDPMSDPELALRRRTEALEIATSDPATAAIVLREWLQTKPVQEVRGNDG